MRVCLSLASVSPRSDNVSQAIGDCERVIGLAKAMGDEQQLRSWSVNLAKLLLNLGAQCMANNELDTAETAFVRAKATAIQVGDRLDEARCMGNLASIYRMRGAPSRYLFIPPAQKCHPRSWHRIGLYPKPPLNCRFLNRPLPF